MGYRSRVMFAIDKTEDVTLRLTRPQVIELLNCAGDTIERTFSDQTPYIVYTWGAIKWYESWPPVAELEAWMESFEDNETATFQFARQGEEDSDLQTLGNHDFGLYHDVFHLRDLLKPVTRKALKNILSAVESEWGDCMEDDLRNAYNLLLPFTQFKETARKVS